MAEKPFTFPRLKKDDFKENSPGLKTGQELLEDPEMKAAIIRFSADADPAMIRQVCLVLGTALANALIRDNQ